MNLKAKSLLILLKLFIKLFKNFSKWVGLTDYGWLDPFPFLTTQNIQSFHWYKVLFLNTFFRIMIFFLDSIFPKASQSIWTSVRNVRCPLTMVEELRITGISLPGTSIIRNIGKLLDESAFRNRCGKLFLVILTDI